jgi:hypothetical protein
MTSNAIVNFVFINTRMVQKLINQTRWFHLSPLSNVNAASCGRNNWSYTIYLPRIWEGRHQDASIYMPEADTKTFVELKTSLAHRHTIDRCLAAEYDVPYSRGRNQ